MQACRRMNTYSKAALKPVAATPLVVAAALLVLVVATAALLQSLLGLGIELVYRAAMLFAVLGAGVAWLAARHLGRQDFGAANRMTFLRAALVVVLAACIGEAVGPGLAWCIIAMAILVLVLDGVDGRLARRDGTVSAFGARFDMEVDALLILVLAILAWQFDKAGAWVLAAGLMRYAFVLASRPLAWLKHPLPYSRRRQGVCVLQIVSLLVCLAPFIPTPLSALAALCGVVGLAGSFAVDIAWLARHAR